MCLGLISLTPQVYLEGADYNPEDVFLPDSFSAWTMIPRSTNITKDLNKYPPNGQTEYSFYGDGNASAKILVRFNRLFDGQIQLFQLPNDGDSFGANKIIFVPSLSKGELIAGWDGNQNVSVIEFENLRGKLTGIFADQNATRNEINTAWDDGEIELTIMIPTDWEDDDDLGAREIVIALLTFNLDSVFRDINPALGFLMSASLMVPLLFVFFTVIMWGLHGEGG
jgi:hypothetical protein